MTQAKTSKKSNHDRAPKSSAFVESMRDVFGEVTVLFVEENGLKLGSPCDQSIELAAATAFDVEGKNLLAKKRAA